MLDTEFSLPYDQIQELRFQFDSIRPTNRTIKSDEDLLAIEAPADQPEHENGG